MIDLMVQDMIGDIPNAGAFAKAAKQRQTFADHCKALADEHAEMADFHKGMHDALDDGHEARPLHRRLAQHHKTKAEIFSSLHESLSGVNLGDIHGPSKVRKNGDEIVDDGVSIVSGTVPSHLRLIPRGSSASSPGAALVDPDLEQLFEL